MQTAATNTCASLKALDHASSVTKACIAQHGFESNVVRHTRKRWTNVDTHSRSQSGRIPTLAHNFALKAESPMMLNRFQRLLGVILCATCASALAQSLPPTFDSTTAWSGVSISGIDAVGQTITTPPTGATLTSFEFFADVPPPFNSYVGGVFEWDQATGTVIGQPLATIAASLPTVSGFPPVQTLAEARVRFEFLNPVRLHPSRTYLLFANSIQPRHVAPSWLVTNGAEPFGELKQIFPPNGSVIGPWTTQVHLAPGPDAWAFRAFLAPPFLATPIPILDASVLIALCLALCGVGVLRLRR